MKTKKQKKPRTHILGIAIDEDTRHELTTRAEQQDRSVSALVRRLIRNYLSAPRESID